MPTPPPPRVADPAAAANRGEAADDVATPESPIHDLLTAAVVFAILGGLFALWMGELSLVTGGLAALASGVGGAMFAKG